MDRSMGGADTQGASAQAQAGVLAGAEGGTARATALAGLLEPQDVLLDVQVADRRALFDLVDTHVAHQHALPKGCAALGLGNRERIGSTGLGDGVAVPHARLRQLGHVCLLYVRLATPIPFDAPDGKPVRDVLVLLVPDKACQQHLDILADVGRLFSSRHLRKQLHRCETVDAVRALLA